MLNTYLASLRSLTRRSNSRKPARKNAQRRRTQLGIESCETRLSPASILPAAPVDIIEPVAIVSQGPTYTATAILGSSGATSSPKATFHTAGNDHDPTATHKLSIGGDFAPKARLAGGDSASPKAEAVSLSGRDFVFANYLSGEDEMSPRARILSASPRIANPVNAGPTSFDPRDMSPRDVMPKDAMPKGLGPTDMSLLGIGATRLGATDHPVYGPVSYPVGNSIIEPVSVLDHPTHGPVSHPVSHPVSSALDNPTHGPVNHPVSSGINGPVGNPVSNPVNHPAATVEGPTALAK